MSEAIDTLDDGLLEFRPDPDGDSLHIYEGVRSIVQNRVRQENLEACCRKLAATLIYEASIRMGYPETASSWPFYEELLPHIWSLATWVDPRKGYDMDLLRACRIGAQALLSRARFEEASKLILQVLSLREECIGPDDTEVLRTKYQLARIRSERGLLDEAEPLLRQVLASRERLLGPAHRHTLNAMQGVADVCGQRKNFGEAESLYKCVLDSLEETNPFGDSLVAMNNLALTYDQQGRYAEAVVLYQRAYYGLRELRGDRDRGFLAAIANLASCYHHLGVYNQAEYLYKRAIAVWEEDFGNEHPSTLNVYVLLGELYHADGSFYEAHDLYKRVCDARATQLGTNHSKFLEIDDLLALLYGNYAEAKSRFSLAERCYNRVLIYRQRIFEKDHPKMLEISRVLEEFDRKKVQQHAEAEKLDPAAKTVYNQHFPIDRSDEQISLQLESTILDRTQHTENEEDESVADSDEYYQSKKDDREKQMWHQLETFLSDYEPLQTPQRASQDFEVQDQVLKIEIALS